MFKKILIFLGVLAALLFVADSGYKLLSCNIRKYTDGNKFDLDC